MKEENKIYVVVGFIAILFVVFVLTLAMEQYENNKYYYRAKELAKDYNENNGMLFAAGLIDQVKEIDIECNHEGVKGDSLIKGYDEVETQKKVDESCVSKYDYKFIDVDSSANHWNNLITMEQYKDKGCIMSKTNFKEVNMTLVKCPLNNCKKKTVIEKQDGYTLDFIKLTEIGAFDCKFKLILK